MGKKALHAPVFLSMPTPLKAISTRVFPTLRELISSYQAFYQGATENVRQFDLSLEQFDIIATLGNTPGMNLLQLSDQTLLTQTDLLQTIGELEFQELIAKHQSTEHPVAIFRLTAIGEKVFQVSFSIHMQYLQERFGQLEDAELEFLQHVLKHLRHSFTSDLG
jgi:MarR family transcriptional regulator, 2-MHQ and catechol-resistance regulon repressor